MRVNVSDVDWDDDDQDTDIEVDFVFYIVDPDDQDELEDSIGDLLTEETGFCHNGFVMTTWLTLAEVSGRLCVDRRTLHRLRKLPDFPQPTLDRCLWWSEREVEAWKASQALLGWAVMWKKMSRDDMRALIDYIVSHHSCQNPPPLEGILENYFNIRP